MTHVSGSKNLFYINSPGRRCDRLALGHGHGPQANGAAPDPLSKLRCKFRKDAAFAVCCAVRVDKPGITIVSRPARRPGDKLEHGDALFSRRYGQSTAVAIFDRVFVPWDRVFYAGEWEHSHALTYSYTTHYRHSCVAARAGFGDLLIGAGALMCEANGLDPATKSNLRDPMVELIKITEDFYACGVAASCCWQPRLRHAPDCPRGIWRTHRRAAGPR